MSRTTAEEKQLWDDQIAKHQRTIAEHESEIARMQLWWDSEPRETALNIQVQHLLKEIEVERVCLSAAVDKRQSLDERSTS